MSELLPFSCSPPTKPPAPPPLIQLPLQSHSNFLGVTFDHTLSFSKHVSSLKAKFFLRFKVLRCIFAYSWGLSKRSLFLLKAVLPLLLTYTSTGWFPFRSATNVTKLEGFHQATNRAITSCLPLSPMQLLFSEASLPPLRVILTHFTPTSYERALRLPTSFPIPGLARLGVKPRFLRSSWRAFASTHPLMLSPSPPMEFLLFAFPLLLAIRLPSLWSSSFPLQAPL